MNSPKPYLVYLAGWGLDPGLWQDLSPALADLGETMILDFGYFGTELRLHPPLHRPIIAVAHSWAVLWLLATQVWDWQGLVAVNGFARFSWAEDFPAGTDRRILDRMLARLVRDPVGVTTEFRLRCGAAAAVPGIPDQDRLRDGLIGLRDADARQASALVHRPVLALCGGADPIAPPALTALSFAKARHLRCETLAGGDHLLPQSAAPWCAQRIRAFLHDVPGLV